MKNNFQFMILYHPRHGHVGVSIYEHNKMFIHLPYKTEVFQPFGTSRSVRGQVYSTRHKLWQVTPKAGSFIRLKNKETGELATYKVLFIGSDIAISLSETVGKIISNYSNELINLDKFTSKDELSGYARVIQAFFKTVISGKYDHNYNFVDKKEFDRRFNGSEDFIKNLDDAILIFVNDEKTFHLDAAMWYLIIYKLNQEYKDNPPFPNVT